MVAKKAVRLNEKDFKTLHCVPFVIEQPWVSTGQPDQKPVRTYIKPVATNNNIAELKNYMEYQKLAPSDPGNKRNLTADIMAKKSLGVPGKESMKLIRFSTPLGQVSMIDRFFHPFFVQRINL